MEPCHQPLCDGAINALYATSISIRRCLGKLYSRLMGFHILRCFQMCCWASSVSGISPASPVDGVPPPLVRFDTKRRRAMQKNNELLLMRTQD